MSLDQLSFCSLLAFDLETTGINAFSDRPVSFALVGYVDGAVVEYGGFVNPDMPIPQEASKVHGITERDISDAPMYLEIVQTIRNIIIATWGNGGAIVGMNVAYDLTMIDALSQQLDGKGFVDLGGVGPVIDILPIDRHFDKFRKGKRTLSDLCAHYEVAILNAHGALDDAKASLDILFTQIRQYPELSKMTIAELGESSRLWYLEWLESLDKYFQTQGKERVASGQFHWPIHEPIR